MLADRRRQADNVKAHLGEHKVCLGCSSVSRLTAAVCSVCKAYQWSTDPAAITEAVDTAAKTAFPFTLGYAPGYPREYRPPG